MLPYLARYPTVFKLWPFLGCYNSDRFCSENKNPDIIRQKKFHSLCSMGQKESLLIKRIYDISYTG